METDVAQECVRRGQSIQLCIMLFNWSQLIDLPYATPTSNKRSWATNSIRRPVTLCVKR